MNGRDQTDKDWRICQQANEKGDDGRKGGEAETGTEESPVHDVNGGVEAYIFMGAAGWLGVISHICLAASGKGNRQQWIIIN